MAVVNAWPCNDIFHSPTQSGCGLNIREAHAFNTQDKLSLDVFVVDGWDPQVFGCVCFTCRARRVLLVCSIPNPSRARALLVCSFRNRLKMHCLQASRSCSSMNLLHHSQTPSMILHASQSLRGRPPHCRYLAIFSQMTGSLIRRCLPPLFHRARAHEYQVVSNTCLLGTIDWPACPGLAL